MKKIIYCLCAVLLLSSCYKRSDTKAELYDYSYLEYEDVFDENKSANTISSYLDADQSTCIVKAKYFINDNLCEKQSSGFIFADKNNEYYVITSYYNISYTYINKYENKFKIENVETVINTYLEVYFNDGHCYLASYVGCFEEYDICVLKFTSKNIYQPLEFDFDYFPNIGSEVYIIGSPNNVYDLSNTTLRGYVSGINRLSNIYHYETYEGKEYGGKLYSYPTFQIDAATNLGMEGGPVLTSEGKVIGINTFKYGSTKNENSYESLAYSIESKNLKNILNSILETGTYNKPKLNISIYDIENLYYNNMGHEWVYKYNICKGVYVTKGGVSKEGICYKYCLEDNVVIYSIENNNIVYQIDNNSMLSSCLVQIDINKPVKINYIDSNNTYKSIALYFND